MILYQKLYQMIIDQQLFIVNDVPEEYVPAYMKKIHAKENAWAARIT